MKNRILHWTSVLLAGSALILSSCTKDDEDDKGSQTPVFPEYIEQSILEGSSKYEIAFTPNMDWTIEIPTDATTAEWFILSDGQVQAYSFSGKASATPVTITVVAVKPATFDETPSCEVSLTMGGQTEKIAKISLSNKIREFALYASTYGTVSDDDFDYVYETTPIDRYEGSDDPETAPKDAIELKWPATKGSYMFVFKVSSNFEWVASTPSWLKLAQKTEIEGEDAYAVRFEADFSDETIDGAVGVIDFYDKSVDKDDDPGNNAHNRYCISMPAFRDVIRSKDRGITIPFDADGYYSDGSGMTEPTQEYSLQITSTKGIEIIPMTPDGYGGYYIDESFDYKKWVTITPDTEWDDAKGVMQTHTYKIQVSPSAEPRTAELLVLPQTVAAKINMEQPLDQQLLDEMNNYQLKTEYQPYLFATINQGVTGSAAIEIAPNSAYQVFFNNGAAKWELLDSEDYFYEDAYLGENFGQDFMEGVPIYRLTYNSIDAEGIQLGITGSYAYQMSYVDSKYLEDRWLSVSENDEKTRATVSMNHSTELTPEAGSKGNITFYNGDGKKAAVVVCVRNY